MARREASATTFTLLSGHSEDTPGEGHKHDSAMPDYCDATLDAWFIGDQRTDYPDTREAVLELRRDLPEYDEGLRQYRVQNHIELTFASEDDASVVEDSVTLATNRDEKASYVAVEGQEGESNVVRDIVESDELEWFDNQSKLRADPERFESGVVREELRGVEGVRASALVGGRDEFIVRMKEKFDELGPAEFLEKTGMETKAVPAFIVRPPTMYTFLDLVAMADGSRLARAWDVTPYPKHFLYVDGQKRDETVFREGRDWRPREDMNPRFAQWVMEEQDPKTPFGGGVVTAFEETFDVATIFEPYRAMYHGEDGETLSWEELFVGLPEPLFPWGPR